MTNVPDPPASAEAVATAMFNHASTDTAGAAVALLCDIPGDLYAQPEFGARYITVHQPPDAANPLAEVRWRKLLGDLNAGVDVGVALTNAHRALLMVAASLGGGGPIDLGGLVAHLEARQINLVVGALQCAAGAW